MSTHEPVIDVAGLARRFGARKAVSGITMRVRPGEVVGLVGANGGGKTTTLRMLAGLLKPSAGNGSVLGADVLRPQRIPRHRIGYMTQSLALYPELTVAENLRFRANVLCAGDSQAINRVVENYRLADVLASRVAQISGGWARRVQFAASVMHSPDLLLLDEPTAGLDARTRRDMWRWISQLALSGSSILISTHDMAEAELCPRILHYREGLVDGLQSPAQMMAHSGAASLEAAVIAEAGG